MSRIARVIIPGCAHHVTQRGVRSFRVFRDDHDRQLYLRFLIEQSRLHQLRFLSWCLMDNHVHFVVVPPELNSLAAAIGEAHRRYTWHTNRRQQTTGYLFQGRFFSCPLDEAHGMRAIRYIERNPVRAGMVAQAWEHPWSSAAFRVGDRRRDPLVADTDRLGTREEWRLWLSADPDERALAVLRKAIRSGRPCGGPEFISDAEHKTGRELHPKRRGPAPKPRISGHNT